MREDNILVHVIDKVANAILAKRRAIKSKCKSVLIIPSDLNAMAEAMDLKDIHLSWLSYDRNYICYAQPCETPILFRPGKKLRFIVRNLNYIIFFATIDKNGDFIVPAKPFRKDILIVCNTSSFDAVNNRLAQFQITFNNKVNYYYQIGLYHVYYYNYAIYNLFYKTKTRK